MLINKREKNALTYAKISESFPKAKGKLSEFIKDALKKFQESIMEEYMAEDENFRVNADDFEIPEITEEIIAASIDNTLSSGAIRSLYDFFDQNNIYVAMVSPIDGYKWGWNIIVEDGLYQESTTDEYESRNKAEIEAFTNAFEALEGKL